MFSVERAHRVQARPLPPGANPRPFLFKLLNYKDRDVILSKARTMFAALVIDNSKISLFPDFSAELQKQSAKFIETPPSVLGAAIRDAISGQAVGGG